MGDISENFSRSEFACKCQCGFDTVDVELIAVLSALRSALGPTKINSGCRCHDHNRAVGGVKDSQHVLGRAADIVVQNVDPDIVVAYLNDHYPEQYGVGSYNTFTHIDTRGKKARW
jgi:uncharacterized protein YcbK (DUF882 family)